MRNVVRAYDARWPALFEAEAGALRAVFGETLAGLHQIGSTAVPGLLAKPVIDMVGEARRLADVDARAPAMEARGYAARGEYGIAGRRYFSKPAATPDGVGFHVHVFALGSPQIARHIRFRDYLIAHPKAARDYAALKASLCDADGVLVADYQDRKAPLIARIDQLAAAAKVSD